MVDKFTDILDPKLVELITDGAVGFLPTDTLYGIVCSTRFPDSVLRLVDLKGRPNNPGTLVAASIDQLVELGLKARYLTAVAQFWPGAVSVVIPAPDSLAHVHLGRRSLAVRIPDNQPLIDLLQKTGPLMTTSANRPNETPASTVDIAEGIFGDEVDFYVDGGDLSDHQPSTIIRVVDDAIELLRPGAVKIDETGCIIN